MKYANTNIQLNIGNSGALVIKNTAKLLGGLALAGMLLMAATFGSVSADSPSKTTSIVAHGPWEMDVQYLNRLGNTFTVHGPNEMDVAYLNILGSNDFLVHDYDAIQPSAKVNNFLVHDFDAIQPSLMVNNFRVHDYDAIQPSLTANNFRVHDYDAIEASSSNVFLIHGPDAVEESNASTYIV